jgi:hypothetical protein
LAIARILSMQVDSERIGAINERPDHVEDFDRRCFCRGRQHDRPWMYRVPCITYNERRTSPLYMSARCGQTRRIIVLG